MFSHWRRSLFYVQEPFCDAPGDPAGGGAVDDPSAHPDYDVDFGDVVVDDPANPQNPGAPAAPPVQDPSRQPGDPGQDPRTPPVDAAAFTQLQQTVIQSQQQTASLIAENRRLMQAIGTLTGQQPGPQQPSADQPQLSEADQKAVAAIYRLFPNLRPLLEKAQELVAIPETVRGFQQDTQSRWNDLGARMWQTFDGEVRKAYGLADGVAMTPFAQKAIDSAFVNWLETDKNAQARYRMGDTTLPAEFMKNYVNGVVVPARARQTPPAVPGQPPTPGQPGVRRPAQQPPRVPRGGPGGAPVTTAPAQPNVKKPDEIHSAAADAYFAQR
jgi:hypothetical protein